MTKYTCSPLTCKLTLSPLCLPSVPLVFRWLLDVPLTCSLAFSHLCSHHTFPTCTRILLNIRTRFGTLKCSPQTCTRRPQCIHNLPTCISRHLNMAAIHSRARCCLSMCSSCSQSSDLPCSRCSHRPCSKSSLSQWQRHPR